MAGLTLLIKILIVSYWTTHQNYAFLLCFNKFVLSFTFCARSVRWSITIFAGIIAFVALSQIRRVIKSPIKSFRTNFKIDFSQFYDTRQCKWWRWGIKIITDTFLERSLSLSVIIKTPISVHIFWCCCKWYIFKVHNLELCPCNLPPPEFLYITGESAFRRSKLSATSKCDLFKSYYVCAYNSYRSQTRT